MLPKTLEQIGECVKTTVLADHVRVGRTDRAPCYNCFLFGEYTDRSGRTTIYADE